MIRAMSYMIKRMTGCLTSMRRAILAAIPAAIPASVISAIVAGTMLALPVLSFASSVDGEKEMYDARIENYAKSMQLDSGSTAISWILLLFLAVVCIGALFKDSKRSHLD